MLTLKIQSTRSLLPGQNIEASTRVTSDLAIEHSTAPPKLTESQTNLVLMAKPRCIDRAKLVDLLGMAMQRSIDMPTRWHRRHSETSPPTSLRHISRSLDQAVPLVVIDRLLDLAAAVVVVDCLGRIELGALQRQEEEGSNL
jgi:hypothetical protein